MFLVYSFYQIALPGPVPFSSQMDLILVLFVPFHTILPSPAFRVLCALLDISATKQVCLLAMRAQLARMDPLSLVNPVIQSV
jgi:hypothetical protein